MALSPKLEIRQGQTLIMTPQLMQAIKLLQMSSLDLTSYVEAEMERNPLLERADGEGSEGAGDREGGDRDGGEREAGEAPSSGNEGSGEGDGDVWLSSELSDSSRDIAQRLDTDLSNIYPDDPGTGRSEAGAGAGDAQQRDPWQTGPDDTHRLGRRLGGLQPGGLRRL